MEGQSLTIKELHEIVANLASEKEDLKEEIDAANNEVDRAIAEVVTSVAEKEAISASRDEALERVATLEAALKDAEASKVSAVQDYLSGPDFAAAVGSSCRRGAEWLSHQLSGSLPDLAGQLAPVAATLIERQFPVEVPAEEDPDTDLQDPQL